MFGILKLFGIKSKEEERIKNKKTEEEIEDIVDEEIRMVIKIFIDISNALIFLHEKNIVHRDVTLKNILVFNWTNVTSVNAKLVDFGISKEIPIERHNYITSSGAGTAPYMAPELENYSFSTKSDVYSFGKSMFFSFFLGYIKTIKNLHESFCSINDPLLRLIDDCCEPEPDHRPEMKKVKEILEKILNCSEPTNKSELNQEGLYFSIGNFDLENAIDEVVKSIENAETIDKTIEIALKILFGKEIDKADIEHLEKESDNFEGKGNTEYLLCKYYYKQNEMNEYYKWLFKSTEKKNLKAIKVVFEYLKDINTKIKANQMVLKKHAEYENFDKNKLIQKVSSELTGIVVANEEKEFIEPSRIFEIFNSFKDIFPICSYYVAVALIHGIGVKRNIKEASSLLNIFEKEFNNKYKDTRFYASLCDLFNTSITDNYNNTIDSFRNYRNYNAKNNKYNDNANNNEIVILYKEKCGKPEMDIIMNRLKYLIKEKKTNVPEVYYNYAHCLIEKKKEEEKKKEKENKEEEFIYYLKKSAEKQFVPALLTLGDYYCKIKNQEEAIKYYCLASKEGSSMGINNLAMCLYKKNPNISEQLFEIAAQMGNKKAQINYYRCVAKKNKEEAIKILEKYSNDANEEVQFTYANILIEEYKKQKDVDKLKKAFEYLKLASKESVDALYNCGLLYKNYYEELGKEKSYAMNHALDCFNAAYKRKHKEATYMLAKMYNSTDYWYNSTNVWLNYMEEASKMGYSKAHIFLANYYEKKRETECYEKAKEYYEKALECDLQSSESDIIKLKLIRILILLQNNSEQEFIRNTLLEYKEKNDTIGRYAKSLLAYCWEYGFFGEVNLYNAQKLYDSVYYNKESETVSNKIKRIDDISQFIPQLEEWCGLEFYQPLFNSNEDVNTVFTEQIKDHSNLYFIVIDENNNIFGHFHGGILNTERNNNENIFMFSLYSNGRSEPIKCKNIGSVCEEQKEQNRQNDKLYTLIYKDNRNDFYYCGNNNDGYHIGKTYSCIRGNINNIFEVEETSLFTGREAEKTKKENSFVWKTVIVIEMKKIKKN